MRQVNPIGRTGFILTTMSLAGVLTGAALIQRSDAVRPSTAIKAAAATLTPFPSTAHLWVLPADVDVNTVRALDNAKQIRAAQRLFDIQAWRAFLALNWPSNPDGSPDPSKNLSDADLSTPRVWSHWINISHIFKKDGAPPDAWPAPFTSMPTLTAPKYKAAWRHWIPQDATENNEAFSGPLVDQNGNWARYEVMVDRPEYDYIVSNKLYSQNGQVAFAQSGKTVDFPLNQGSKIGAMEIKFAWKQLGANDNPKHFFCTWINVPGHPKPIKAGLVGMHISMRTQSSPEWIWATFEHVDNAPDLIDSPQYPNNHPTLPAHLKSHYNFFNPTLGSSVPLNALPPKNADPDPQTGLPTGWDEAKTTTPVQVVHLQPTAAEELRPQDAQLRVDVDSLNTQVEAFLRSQSSVFQYYKLNGTQWPVNPYSPATPGGQGSAPDSIIHKTPGDMIPVYLVNSTMETYFQHGVQNAGALEQDDRLLDNSVADTTQVFGTESCVGCHYSAGIVVRFKRDKQGHLIPGPDGHPIPEYGINGNFGHDGNAEFSWLLEIEAQSKPLAKTSHS